MKAWEEEGLDDCELSSEEQQRGVEAQYGEQMNCGDDLESVIALVCTSRDRNPCHLYLSLDPCPFPLDRMLPESMVYPYHLDHMLHASKAYPYQMILANMVDPGRGHHTVQIGRSLGRDHVPTAFSPAPSSRPSPSFSSLPPALSHA